MKRGVVALAVLVMSLVAVVGSPPTPAHAALRIPVGVATVSTMSSGTYTSTQATTEMGRIKSMGAVAVRIPVKWNLVQASSSTSYTWDTVDTAVTVARAQGLAIVMNLNGPAPVWAQKAGADPTANGNAPADPTTFGNFARAVALRYSSRVTVWEIWNEPNLSEYLIPPTVAAYVPLLQAAYTGIRSTGSNQSIITGGLSSSRDETRDTTFISGLYSAGAKAYLNGIGIHPYTFPYPISADARGGDGGGANVIPAGRAIMVANGDGAKSLWITEYGAPTGSTSASVSEATQSSILVDAINRTNALSYIAAFIIFNSQDITSDPTYENGNFGLYRYDGTAKPAVAAIQSLLIGS